MEGKKNGLAQGKAGLHPYLSVYSTYSTIFSLPGRPGGQSQSLGKDAQCSPVLAFERHSLPFDEVLLFLADAWL